MPYYTLGAIPDIPDERDYPAHLYLPSVEAPPALDMRPGMSGMRDQARLGSCAAHGPCAQKEYFDRRETPAGDNLSEQYLYGRAKAIDGYPGEGTYARTVMDILRREGVCEERFQPYEGRYPPLHGPAAGAAENALLYRIAAYAAVRVDPAAMKQAMAAAGPLGVTVKVFSNFYNTPSSGRVPAPAGRLDGYHMMASCGYDIDGVWVKNSWGANWAAKGYCKYQWSVWAQVGMGAWSVVDIPNVLKHWPDWPDGQFMAEQDVLFKSGIMQGFPDGTFRPWDTCLRRHVCLILHRLGKPYPPGGTEDYTPATRQWTRDTYPGLEWLENRDGPLTRLHLALLVARAL